MKTLLIIDVQNDFLPGGALPVPDGDKVIPFINEVQKDFDLILATKDWHPEHHKSFAIEHGKKAGEIIELSGILQVLWPVHCVQNSFGAQFPKLLNTQHIEKVFYKGIEEDVDSYSAFFDNAGKRSTGLAEYLTLKNIKKIHILGLATDYCVKYSVLDALKLGFSTVLLLPGCRGINRQKDDVDNAIKEMKKAGAEITDSS